MTIESVEFSCFVGLGCISGSLDGQGGFRTSDYHQVY